MTSKEHSVVQHPFFLNLPTEHLQVVTRIVETRHFPSGKTLFQQGQLANSVYFILEGRASLNAKIPGGAEVNLATLDNGELLGELALLPNHRRSATAIAETPITALRMDKNDLSALYAHYHPASLIIMHRLGKTLAHRIQCTHRDAAHIRGDQCETPMQKCDSEIVTGAEFDVRNFLSTLPFFNRFSDSNITDLLSIGTIMTVPKNSIVPISENNQNDCYVVIRGAVETRLHGKDLYYQTEVLGPGTTFGEIDWLLDCSTASIVRSLSRTTLLSLPGSHREQFMDPQLHLSFRFHESLIHSLLSKLDIQTRRFARRQQSLQLG
ncbi:MAG: cyclic nucleotide-binding domain-containing protein [Acidiferrobacterales bacterium]|nr:cyclic nucleotide-binding domain-containing protein [Acidiferrobacterales bacterium]